LQYEYVANTALKFELNKKQSVYPQHIYFNIKSFTTIKKQGLDSLL